MSTQATVETKAKAETRRSGEPRSYGVRLVGADGELLWCRAIRVNAGWRTEALHRSGKARARGASADHPTVEPARAALDKMVAAALKGGWTRREGRGGGFARRPDAFDLAHLPKPGRK